MFKKIALIAEPLGLTYDANKGFTQSKEKPANYPLFLQALRTSQPLISNTFSKF